MDLVIDKSIIDTWNKKKQPYFIAVLISLALLITALALFIALVVSIVSDGEPNFSSFILIVIFAGLGSFVGGKARQRFKKLNHEFKETIMATLLPTVLPNSTYSHVGGHDIDEAAATKIIRKCGFFSLSDTIDGQMNNIDFKISSARAYNHITTTDDKGNQQRSTVYSLYGR